MSEELEHSLQQAVETYVNERLRNIDDQLAKLQSDVNEALNQLREKSGAESLDGTALSASIFAHLQTARGQKLSGVTLTPPEVKDSRAIRRATEEIEQQSSQSEILRSLLMGAVQFAERVALFVIKGDQAIGWRIIRASDPQNLEMIGGVSLPLSAQTIVTRAAHSRSSQASDMRSDADDHLLVDQLGGQPQFGSAVPLIVRNKVVAVLYADSTSADASAINEDALQVLARVAATAVGLASFQRAPATKPEASVVARPADPTAAPEPYAAPEPEPAYTPQVESQAAETQPEVAAEAEAPTQEFVAAPTTESGPSTTESTTEVEPPQTVWSPEVQAASEAPEQPAQTETAPAIETAPAPQVQEPAPAPEVASSPFISEYVAPLGGARRYGVSEPELPIDVSEEERRLHNDARRYARLLVSEIKLYNEAKVKEGRSAADLYDRLREDIDRSRQMYDKRVAPPVAARHDYFHQELVNLLAEGDAAKLGGNYQSG